MPVVSLTYCDTPLLMNAERRMHHHQRAAEMKKWRHAFTVLALTNHLRPLEAAGIEVDHTVGHKRTMPDAGACFPAVKAAVDGLVDAGVLPDDGPRYVRWLRFNAPARGPVSSVTLTIHPIGGTE